MPEFYQAKMGWSHDALLELFDIVDERAQIEEVTVTWDNISKQWVLAAWIERPWPP